MPTLLGKENLNLPPSTESSRLQELSKLQSLGTGWSVITESIVRVAAQVSGCRSAWVSIIGQDTEAAFSVVGGRRSSIPRAGAASEGVLLQRGAVTLRYPMLKVPVEVDEAIGFFHAEPILLSSGMIVGALAVAGPPDVTLSDNAVASLAELAQLAATFADRELSQRELHQELEATRGNERKLAEYIDRLQDAHLQMQMQEVSLAERNQELHTMATTDGLTGLQNYRSLIDGLSQRLIDREGFAFLIIDIDWFKNFNDVYGHVAGDQTLREVAALIASNTRDTDVAARYGGEEFAMVLSVESAAQALEIAERLRRQIEAHPWALRPITICVGIARMTSTVTNVDDLVRRADAALYAAKRSGKNRVLAWSEE